MQTLDEFALIDRIEANLRRGGAPPASESPGVVLGIGDDAAVLRPRAGHDIVVSTDSVVEGVHFRFDWEGATSIGRRALTAALSDLAAMGARPLGAVVGLAAPPGLELAQVDRLARGLGATARLHGCAIVGGNVSRSRDCSLAITVVGEVVRGRALLRSAARPGDRICVTGQLGRSALARERARIAGARIRHQPAARIDAGRALARLPGVGACIDVSDGLAGDLAHLLRASDCGAEIEATRVPRTAGFDAACRRLALDPLAIALCGGDDYELLFTVRPKAPSAAQLTKRLGVVVTELGRTTRARAVKGLEWLRGATGHRHFGRP